VTSELRKDLEEHRRNKQLAQHITPLAAYQDCRATLATVQREVRPSKTTYRWLTDYHID